MKKPESSESSGKTLRKSLGGILVEQRFITDEQLDDALKLQQMQGGKLSDILLNQGLIRPEDLAQVISLQLNYPLIDLKRHMVHPDALRLVPEDMARKHTLIPLDVVGDWIVGRFGE